MRVLFDTNILLDLFLDREPFADLAAVLWQANEEGRIIGYVSAITPVNFYYVDRRFRNQSTAHQAVAELLAALRVCPLDFVALEQALSLPFTDYEDAFQYACAVNSNLDATVTRNLKDFSEAKLPVYDPQQMLHKLELTNQ